VPAVAAHVDEGVQPPTLLPRDHDGHVAGKRGEERARLRDEFGPTDELPRAPEDAIALELRDRRVRVPLGRQRRAGGERFPELRRVRGGDDSPL
jgi:hypothetical protein